MPHEKDLSNRYNMHCSMTYVRSFGLSSGTFSMPMMIYTVNPPLSGHKLTIVKTPYPKLAGVPEFCKDPSTQTFTGNPEAILEGANILFKPKARQNYSKYTKRKHPHITCIPSPHTEDIVQICRHPCRSTMEQDSGHIPSIWRYKYVSYC